jgi:hypothetical protein
LRRARRHAESSPIRKLTIYNNIQISTVIF